MQQQVTALEVLSQKRAYGENLATALFANRQSCTDEKVTELKSFFDGVQTKCADNWRAAQCDCGGHGPAWHPYQCDCDFDCHGGPWDIGATHARGAFAKQFADCSVDCQCSYDCTDIVFA